MVMCWLVVVAFKRCTFMISKKDEVRLDFHLNFFLTEIPSSVRKIESLIFHVRKIKL